MFVRYDMHRDDEGYTVFDIWTGWPAIVKGTEQVGLDIEDADDLGQQPGRVTQSTKLRSDAAASRFSHQSASLAQCRATISHPRRTVGSLDLAAAASAS
jgi:hypothetical protein